MKIEITDKQAYVIQRALEVYARLGMGQFHDALDCMPLKTELSGWHEDNLEIGRILRKHMKGNVDGWLSYLGIKSPDVSDYSRIAWDIYQVIRTICQPTRGVFRVSDEPLVVITRRCPDCGEEMLGDESGHNLVCDGSLSKEIEVGLKRVVIKDTV